MIQKSIFILMLSCTGAGYFIGETEIGEYIPFLNSEFHQGVKKKNLPKPKSFYSKRKASNDFTGSTTIQFSFFPVLNDPSLSKMVDLNGEIIKKYDSSPAPVAQVRKVQSNLKIHRKISAPVSPVKIEKARSKITIPSLQPSMPKKANMVLKRGSSKRMGRSLGEVVTNPSLVNTRSSGTPPTGSEELNNERTGQTLLPENSSHVNIGSSGTLVSYVVQVSAFRQWQQAQTLKAVLEKKGYASFIGKTKLPDNSGTWYRVYIGRYFNRAGAEMAAARFHRKENRKAMVVRQTG